MVIVQIAILIVVIKGNTIKKYSLIKYFKFADFDSLRDEGIAYANKLKTSNVDVELYNTTATMHGFDMAGKSKIVIKSIGRRTNFLRECFK